MTLREKKDQLIMQEAIQKYCPERTISYVSREELEAADEEKQDEENPDDESYETKNAPDL